MTGAAVARLTLPERFFPLEDAPAVDRFLAGADWSAIFKAGSGDRTVDAWILVQRAFEPRVDVAIGFLQLPGGRAASDRINERTGIPHRSPQLIVFHRDAAVAHLDERAIAPEPLRALMQEHLPSTVGPGVVNEQVASLSGFCRLLDDFVSGRLPDERFQWAFLERLEKESVWRDDRTFDRLNGLFDNPDGRKVRPARLIAREFQDQLGGRAEPLKTRARRLLAELDPAGTGDWRG